jgi:thiamine kinase-like enzyme
MVIHKKGFSKTGFEREIAARSGPAACVAPRFLGLEANGTAFAEEYFIGTPANRFSTGREEIVRSEARVRLISEVHRPTLRSTSLSDYLDKLNKEISAVSEGMEESTRRITDWIIETAGDCEIGLVFSHGDFQDANILVEGDALRIIDWENATERTQLYDLVTMKSRIRMASDSFSAWQKEVGEWDASPRQFPKLEVPASNRHERLSHAVLWWLEEILFLLEEERASPFTDISPTVDRLANNTNSVLEFLKSLR